MKPDEKINEVLEIVSQLAHQTLKDQTTIDYFTDWIGELKDERTEYDQVPRG